MRIEEGFQQTPFSDDAPYTTDPVIPDLLRRLFPQSVRAAVEPDIQSFEKEITTTIRAASHLVSPPQLTQYNQWGQRVDTLHTSEGWRILKAICHKEGLISISYAREHGEYSRVHAFTKILLMTGDGQVVFCPMSMTDGSARAIELYGTPTMKERVFPRLVSRDPSTAFTSGQWMTERPGGSDVSQTETTAFPASHAFEPLGTPYTLDGFKWFSSATDSNIAVALARTGTAAQGSRGLSLFLIPLRLPLFPPSGGPLPAPTSNNILVHRLKNKIGTHIVPTAELELRGSQGYLLGRVHDGVRCILPVLGITRIHSGVASLGALRKCLAIARSFATVRRIRSGTQLLVDTPLHVAELARVTLVYRALAHLAFGVIHLLGKTECGTASAEDVLRFRVLTPILKGFAAEKAVAAMEECMAALGGQGYMEENVIGRLIRDALVEKIWEGTITVLAVDVLRSIEKPGVLESFVNWAQSIIASVPDFLRAEFPSSLSDLSSALQDLSTAHTAPVPALVPRPAFMLISHVACAVYLLEHTVWAHVTGSVHRYIDAESFRRWVDEGGMKAAREEVARARREDVAVRGKADLVLVYGEHRAKTKL
ncbi:acyl-CoA dehydrogenase domain-containing protein [Auriscalpium vulgare]|uniref:Acyl-CoA dehydrogenase domain-containing protein n=1 Tax=Auriscalpium vulgare TaxID=40419 RepID=A0ACB8S2P5_9AGAM|nr:acyl-CoA dehydrogenase domain-containing protein [Auriscalpium vulgare]